MKPSPRPVIKTGSGADLAFAVVVLTSYFVTFSSLQNANLTEIGLMVTLGIGYVGMGVYGYAYCARSESAWLRIAYFAIQIPLGAAIVYLGKGAGLNAMVLLPLAAHSVVLLGQGGMYAANGLIIGAYILPVYLFTGSRAGIWGGFQTFLAGQIFVIVFTTMAIGEEKARKEVERLVVDLEQANQRLREYALQASELATIKERNRLAREIHDGLGHYLTTIYMQAQAARAVFDTEPEHSLHALNTVQNLSRDALDDVRQSVAALRAPLEEGLALPDRIRRLLPGFETSGLTLEFVVKGTLRDLPYQMQQTLFRAVQEGLNNITKHSRANLVNITLDYTNTDEVSLQILDNGQGAEDYRIGFGLMGLEERLHLLNGRVQITTASGQGFHLDIRVPE